MEKLCNRLDGFIKAIGLAVSWANGLLVIAIIANVILRYVCGYLLKQKLGIDWLPGGQIWLEEMQWHLYAVACMIGASYSQAVNSHIRVDLLHQRMRPRTRAFWELFGIIVFLLPWITCIFFLSVEYWQESWHVNEHSDSPLGLPWRWVIKGVIPMSFLLLGIASVSKLIRNFLILFTAAPQEGEVAHGD